MDNCYVHTPEGSGEVGRWDLEAISKSRMRTSFATMWGERKAQTMTISISSIGPGVGHLSEHYGSVNVTMLRCGTLWLASATFHRRHPSICMRIDSSTIHTFSGLPHTLHGQGSFPSDSYRVHIATRAKADRWVFLNFHVELIPKRRFVKKKTWARNCRTSASRAEALFGPLHSTNQSYSGTT
ncbi:hypothetical protein BD779DRAFT_662988 [Infundibulicybe gibba]|nr:hypothetical protein BD779DRAFT_662988 [Infundibulicybe gibba]